MTQLSNALQQFEEVGVAVIRDVLSSVEVTECKNELTLAMESSLSERPDVFDAGMVHNCMLYGRAMAFVLDNELINEIVGHVLSDTFILYAYQASSIPPNGKNFSSRVHVDCPRFIENYISNVGVILPLDDFTEVNGATEYLAGSHRIESLPTEEEFDTKMQKVICEAGSMVLFNSRLAHRGGINKTRYYRHALTLNMCRSYMRQRFDFPRLLSDGQITEFGPIAQRLLGFHVRMPTSVDEFYLPEADRLYKAGQG